MTPTVTGNHQRVIFHCYLRLLLSRNDMIKWLWLSYRTLVFIIFHTQMGFMDVHPLSHSRCLVGFDPSLEWNGYIDFLKWTTKSPKSFDHYSIDTYGDLGNHHDFRDPHMDAMDGTYITGKITETTLQCRRCFSTFLVPRRPSMFLCAYRGWWSVEGLSGARTDLCGLSSPLWCTHRPLWIFHTVSCDQYVGWIQGVRRRVSTVVDSVLWPSHGCPLVP